MVERVASGRSFLDPVAILEHLDLGPGMQIGDFGVGGAAYFAVQAAKMAGDRGRVFGVDIFKPALSSALSKAKLSGLKNFVPVWSDLERVGAATAVRSGSLDAGILVNVLLHAKHQADVLRECSRMLKSGSRLLIVEWATGGQRFGPRPEQVLPRQRVLDLCTQAGLAPMEQFEAGPHHYGLVVVKAG